MIWALAYLAGALLTVYVFWRMPSQNAERITLGICFGLMLFWPLIAVVALCSFIASVELPEPPKPKVKRLAPEIEAALREVEEWVKR